MAEVTLEETPRKVRDLFEKGYVAMERGNLDYAIDLFFSVIELEPGFLHARKYLRTAEVKKFQASKGGKVAHVLSSISGAPTLLAGMGLIKKDPLKALIVAEKLLRKDPLNMKFINFFGQAALAADLPEAALQTLELAKELNPKDTDLLTWLGHIYQDNKNPQKAKECFEDLVRLLPNDQKALKLMKDAAALATMKQGGWDDAGTYRDVIKDTKEAKVLEQDNKAVKSQKDIESLIKETKAKMVQEPGNVNYKRALADLYTKDGRFDEAISVLEAAQKAGADPQIDLSISRIKTKRFESEIKKLRDAGDEAAAVEKEKMKNAFLLEDARRRVERYPNDLQFHHRGLLLTALRIGFRNLLRTG